MRGQQWLKSADAGKKQFCSCRPTGPRQKPGMRFEQSCPKNNGTHEAAEKIFIALHFTPKNRRAFNEINFFPLWPGNRLA
jgi:hypothetical protein